MKARESSLPDSTGDLSLPAGLGGAVRWTFRLGASALEWDWSDGPPSLRELSPVRIPASGARSRHVPVRAFSTTTQQHVVLESGLEHDLLRVLDRDPRTAWITTQPCRIEWLDAGRPAARHVPDLLSVDVDGQVTLWDVRPEHAARTVEFVALMAATSAAAADVGLSFSVFSGISDVHRFNLLWLHGYRHRPGWADRWEEQLIERASSGARLGDLVQEDDQQAALVWHLIWSGRLVVDLSSRLDPTTEVAPCRA
ncbi:TnsA-like heteromeric transposase endonuclease subunit [uncultured Nocardioides sp.]|uniref:TnsA-like heteromeric transposase endonuclease subunit n=1 Tax=uncultured Nocardioides sp. TaxID=198441 RepID=UPI00260F7250|nr:TnsA-like heteromeric transposase endonuclease subunit [uncultured Nocardioides sp.]